MVIISLIISTTVILFVGISGLNSQAVCTEYTKTRLFALRGLKIVGYRNDFTCTDWVFLKHDRKDKFSIPK